MADWAIVNIVGFQHQVDVGKEIQLAGYGRKTPKLSWIGFVGKIGSFIGQPVPGAKLRPLLPSKVAAKSCVATYKSVAVSRSRGCAYQTKIKIEKLF
jgi:hypothetical protein